MNVECGEVLGQGEVPELALQVPVVVLAHGHQAERLRALLVDGDAAEVGEG